MTCTDGAAIYYCYIWKIVRKRNQILFEAQGESLVLNYIDHTLMLYILAVKEYVSMRKKTFRNSIRKNIQGVESLFNFHFYARRLDHNFNFTVSVPIDDLKGPVYFLNTFYRPVHCIHFSTAGDIVTALRIRGCQLAFCCRRSAAVLSYVFLFISSLIPLLSRSDTLPLFFNKNVLYLNAFRANAANTV